MLNDPIIQEIREIRRKIEDECQNTPQKYYEYLLKLQNKYVEKLVQRNPRPIAKLEKVS